jgi:hypothetical protein
VLLHRWQNYGGNGCAFSFQVVLRNLGFFFKWAR